MPKQDIKGIVTALAEYQARHRRIPLGGRRILVKQVKGADFRVNRYDIEVDVRFATAGNPISMINKVLDAVEEFDTRDYYEQVRKVNEVKSSVLKWCAYLERTLTVEAYADFVHSLLPEPEPEPVLITDLAPDGLDELDLEALAILAHGELLTQHLGVHYRA